MIGLVCADNTNKNFGGAAHKGVNVFYKLNNSLKQNVIWIGCITHVINNAVQTVANNLSVDIESIIVYCHTFIL